MGLTITNRKMFPYPPGVLGSHRMGICNIAFDDSYPTGGEAITAANLLIGTLKALYPIDDMGGYIIVYDDTNGKIKAYAADLSTTSGTPTFAQNTGIVTDDDSAASNGTAVQAIPDLGGVMAHFASVNANGADAVFDIGSAGPSVNVELSTAVNTGGVKDDDSAESNGTDVNVVPESNGILAFLESTNAGNADSVAELGDGGPLVQVHDNDAPGGVVLYFDEDAANPDSRFLCISPTGKDIFVPVSDGSFIRVAHDASADSTGVAIHFDDNGANVYERLLFISPTDAEGVYTTDDEVTTKAASLESPVGVQVYFDEDAAADEERFLVISPTGTDMYVPVSDGSMIRLKHDASADSNGVAVYFDDNGASAHLRFLFVSPTDTVGAFTTDDDVSMQLEEAEAIADAALAEVANGTNLSVVTGKYMFIGV